MKQKAAIRKPFNYKKFMQQRIDELKDKLVYSEGKLDKGYQVHWEIHLIKERISENERLLNLGNESVVRHIN